MSINDLKRKTSTANSKNHQSAKDIMAKKKKESGDNNFLKEESEEDLEALAELRVCRVCLSIDVKMDHILEHKLRFIYEQLVGVTISAEDRLPKMLCFECAARLLSAKKLRDTAINSQHTLLTALPFDKNITLKDIKSLKHNFNSTLSQEHLINGNDVMIKIEVKKESSIASDEDNVSDDDTRDDGMGDSKDDGEIDNPDVYEEIKIEKSDILENNLSVNIDDNKCLSEIKKCVKRKDSQVKESSRATGFKKKGKKIDVKNPLSTMDRNKKSGVKRLKKKLGVDESLFSVTPLSHEEQIAEREKRKESDSYKDAIFKCTICYRGFPNKENYESHMMRHSEKSGAFECFICKTRFKMAYALRKHLTAHHTEKFSCKKCPFTTRNRGTARRHENWHSGARYHCPHCPSEFDKVTTYMGHIRIKHASKFVCGLCGYTFVSKKGIEVHKKKKHRILDTAVELEGPYCKECDVRFISEEAHDRHLKLSSLHSNDHDPNRLRNDSQSSRSRKGIRSFERRSHIHPKPLGPSEPEREKGPMTCEKCGLVLNSLHQYAGHFLRAHPGETWTELPMANLYMCEQCGRQYQYNSQLESHMWIHTGVKRYQCEHCDKSFANKTSLIFHLRVHGDYKKTFDCNICGKSFSYPSNRKRHMFIHSDLKPFTCDVCGKAFRTAVDARTHFEHVHNKKPWPKRVRNKRPATTEAEIYSGEDTAVC